MNIAQFVGASVSELNKQSFCDLLGRSWYEPFVYVCLRHRNYVLERKYLENA